MFLRKPFAWFVFCLVLGALLIAPQQSMAQPFYGTGDILILSDHDTGNNGGTFHIWPGIWAWPNHDGVTTQTYDQSLRDLLTTWFPNAVTTETNCGPQLDERGMRNIQSVNTAAKVAWVNSYDILIVSNSIGSGDLAGNAAASTIWDTSITQPMLCMKPFLTGTNSNRWSWYPYGNPLENLGTTPTTHLSLLVPGTDPYFNGIDCSSGSLRLYNDGPYSDPSNVWWSSGSTTTTLNSVGQRLPAPVMTSTWGRHLAHFTGYNSVSGNRPLGLVSWDGPTTVGTLFYTGGARRRGGDRVLLSMNDDRNMVPYAEVGVVRKIARDMIPELTPQGQRLLANIIVTLVPSLPASMSEFKIE